MSLSDLASLGGFVSGVAVLVSLVLLYFQLRNLTAQVVQGEKNQRAVLNERYISRTMETFLKLADSHVDLRSRILAGDTAFTAGELLRLSFQFRSLLLNVQDVWLQRKSGLIDEPTFDVSMLALKNSWLSLPVFRALWIQVAPMIGPEFRTAVDAIIKETPLAKRVDIVAQFNADLVKVMA
jgi:hypothetical protein